LADVKNKFLLAARGFKFCLVSYVCAFACHTLSLTGKNAMEEGKYNHEDRINLLDEVTEALIDFEWKDFEKECAADR
jgi:hypothetical protein